MSTKDIILYRGDAKEIKKFRVEKTFENCLFGQGIYLTNKEKVADTYRTKGSYKGFQHRQSVLLDMKMGDEVKNKMDALEYAFVDFLLIDDIFGAVDHWRIKNALLFELTGDDKYKRQVGRAHIYQLLNDERLKISEARKIFDRYVDNGRITIDYRTDRCGPVEESSKALSRLGVKVVNLSRITRKPSEYRYNKYVTVTYHHGRPVGFLSQFKFTDTEIKNTMLDVERIRDKEIWIQLHKFEVENLTTGYRGTTGDIDTYFQYRVGYRIPALKPHQYKKFQTFLSEYGYKGFEYDGGLRLGGGKRHRAFCVWDESWINQHRVVEFAASLS